MITLLPFHSIHFQQSPVYYISGTASITKVLYYGGMGIPGKIQEDT